MALWKSIKNNSTLALLDVGVQFKMIVEPFHPWSFTSSVGAYTAGQHSTDAFSPFAEACWVHGHGFITQWGNEHYVLANLTEEVVVAKMATFAVDAGVAEAGFYSGMTNSSAVGGTNPWAVAREAWKQAVVRGAASSPWYFVNEVPYFAASDALHLGQEGWITLIQNLLAKQPQ